MATAKKKAKKPQVFNDFVVAALKESKPVEITPAILLQVDKLVFAKRDKGTPHVKGTPYAAEWLAAFMAHPKTAKLFK